MRTALFWLTSLLLLLFGGSAQAQRPVGAGLQGQYYSGRNFEQLVVTRTDPTIDFNWTLGPNGEHFVSPAPDVPGEYFSVRWTGYLYVPVTGTYTFEAATDDGMRVWVGGRRLVDSWRGQPVSIITARIRLIAGRYYPVRVEYFQLDRDSRARLAWQLPASTAEAKPVSPHYLYPRLPATAVPVREVVPPRPRVTAAPVVAAKPAVPLQPAPVRRTVLPRRVQVATRRASLVVSRSADTVVAELPVLTITKGSAMVLPQLYFTQSTAVLLPASRPTLNALARVLREQPALQLEIAGHTDNVGEPALNQRLSEQRARVVRRYLVHQGIDSTRLTTRGYGGTRPVADNLNPRQRPRNRRVEVVVQ
ncbi:OmpA family protein [Hymenobacter sp. BT728]|nr:OmpA family protein [Hymenobacter pini]